MVIIIISIIILSVSVTRPSALPASGKAQAATKAAPAPDAQEAFFSSINHLKGENESVGRDDDNNNKKKSPSFPSCSLYFAPSTIPNAGWGVYTARDLNEGDPVGESMDIIVPIIDTYKTLPYRGQHRFLSWLAYIWPKEMGTFFTSETAAFPSIEPGQFKLDDGLNFATEVEFFYSDGDGGQRMNAFSPGIASQANSHEEWDNLLFQPQESHSGEYYHLGHFQIYEGEEGDHNIIIGNNNKGDKSIGIGPRSRYHHGGLATNQFVPAGSELFLFYGYEYHDHRREKRYSQQNFQTLEEYKNKMDFSTLSTEQEKRDLLDETTMTLRTDEDAQFDNREGSLGARIISEEETRQSWWYSILSKGFEIVLGRQRHEEEEEVVDGENPPGRSLDWLESHGVCMDHLTVKESTIPSTGKGAFAKHFISAGDVVSHAPLLHMKRDDLAIYGKVQHERRGIQLDFDRVEGHELLLNYCLGHPESELLLLPYSPVVNYINHDAGNPNTMIRWTDGAKAYFDMHPIDILEQPGGTLRVEYVALRDIEIGEEITIHYGSEWETALQDFRNNTTKEDTSNHDKKLDFRHEIGVPKDLYPEKWLHTPVRYELAPKGDLQPGELKQMVWKHNGKAFTKFAHHLGLPKSFSQQMLKYTEDIGIMSVFDNLLQSRLLESDEWYVFNATMNSTGTNAGQFFAQRYKSGEWGFNMHYLSAWDEVARRNFLAQIGRAGFDEVMNGIGTHFDLDNIVCFHASYMGVSECDSSFTHTDIYATGEVTYNIIWPITLVNGSLPELNLQADDGNIVISINYEYDTAILMGDWGYHYTSPIEGYTGDEKRVVVGMYCGQIDDNNSQMLANLYDGEDPAPFMGQFQAPYEYHWSKGHDESHRMSILDHDACMMMNEMS